VYHPGSRKKESKGASAADGQDEAPARTKVSGKEKISKQSKEIKPHSNQSDLMFQHPSEHHHEKRGKVSSNSYGEVTASPDDTSAKECTNGCARLSLLPAHNNKAASGSISTDTATLTSSDQQEHHYIADVF
jgi:hypothetical protein